MPQSFQTSLNEYYNYQMLTNLSWGNEYSPIVDGWLEMHSDRTIFEHDSPTTETYIQPHALSVYESTTSTNSSPQNQTTTSHFSASSLLASPSENEEKEIEPKQDSISASSPTTILAVPRKRGRPRNIRRPEDTLYDNSLKSPTPTRRQPHNQVERKYREGLNAELESLRLVLPKTRWELANGSEVRASKAAVLAAAVNYIHELEQGREVLRRENEILRNRLGARRPTYK